MREFIRHTEAEIIETLKLVKRVGLQEAIQRTNFREPLVRSWCKKADVKVPRSNTKRDWDRIKSAIE